MDKMTLEQSESIPIKWPSGSKKNGLCLTCDKTKRELFSWFCSDSCEKRYIDENHIKLRDVL